MNKVAVALSIIFVLSGCESPVAPEVDDSETSTPQTVEIEPRCLDCSHLPPGLTMDPPFNSD